MISINPYPDLAEISSLPIEKIATISMDEMHRDVDKAIGDYLQSSLPPRDIARLFIPSSGSILAMLIDDRDSEEFADMDGLSWPANIAYQHIADVYPTMSKARKNYTILFESLHKTLKAVQPPIPSEWSEKEIQNWKGDITLPHLFSFPRREDLDNSHTFALDIFLKEVQYLRNDEQQGPMIHSLSDGIVIAAEGGWRGFPRKSPEYSYFFGGISPKSGNGVIVFSPRENRYFLYFHLYDVIVEKGQIIQRGQPLGHGGNSGINARKKGGGDHLHIEIYDTQKENFLRNTEIISLLRNSAKY